MGGELGDFSLGGDPDQDIQLTSRPRYRTLPRSVHALFHRQYVNDSNTEVHIGQVRNYRKPREGEQTEDDPVFWKRLTDGSVEDEDKYMADRLTGKVSIRIDQDTGPNKGIIGVRPLSRKKTVSMSLTVGPDSKTMATLTLFVWNDTKDGPRSEPLRTHTMPLPANILGPAGEIQQRYLEGHPLPKRLAQTILDFRLGQGQFAKRSKKKK